MSVFHKLINDYIVKCVVSDKAVELHIFKGIKNFTVNDAIDNDLKSGDISLSNGVLVKEKYKHIIEMFKEFKVVCYEQLLSICEIDNEVNLNTLPEFGFIKIYDNNNGVIIQHLQYKDSHLIAHLTSGNLCYEHKVMNANYLYNGRIYSIIYCDNCTPGYNLDTFTIIAETTSNLDYYNDCSKPRSYILINNDKTTEYYKKELQTHFTNIVKENSVNSSITIFDIKCRCSLLNIITFDKSVIPKILKLIKKCTNKNGFTVNMYGVYEDYEFTINVASKITFIRVYKEAFNRLYQSIELNETTQINISEDSKDIDLKRFLKYIFFDCKIYYITFNMYYLKNGVLYYINTIECALYVCKNAKNFLLGGISNNFDLPTKTFKFESKVIKYVGYYENLVSDDVFTETSDEVQKVSSHIASGFITTFQSEIVKSKPDGTKYSYQINTDIDSRIFHASSSNKCLIHNYKYDNYVYLNKMFAIKHCVHCMSIDFEKLIREYETDSTVLYLQSTNEHKLFSNNSGFTEVEHCKQNLCSLDHGEDFKIIEKNRQSLFIELSEAHKLYLRHIFYKILERVHDKRDYIVEMCSTLNGYTYDLKFNTNKMLYLKYYKKSKDEITKNVSYMYKTIKCMIYCPDNDTFYEQLFSILD